MVLEVNGDGLRRPLKNCGSRSSAAAAGDQRRPKAPPLTATGVPRFAPLTWNWTIGWVPMEPEPVAVKDGHGP